MPLPKKRNNEGQVQLTAEQENTRYREEAPIRKVFYTIANAYDFSNRHNILRRLGNFCIAAIGRAS